MAVMPYVLLVSGALYVVVYFEWFVLIVLLIDKFNTEVM